jgi:hypothetical protein
MCNNNKKGKLIIFSKIFLEPNLHAYAVTSFKKNVFYKRQSNEMNQASS